MGLGPIAERSWSLFVPVAQGIILVSGGLALLGVWRHKGLERQRAIGVLIFFGSVVAFALALAWGRAGVIIVSGHWPPRYALLAVPIFCTTYFIWELYGSPTLRTIVQVSLLVGMLFLLPFNLRRGLLWNDYYQTGLNKVEQDIMAGTPPPLLAERHGEFLIWWWDRDQLVEGMYRLRKAGIGPFAKMTKIEASLN